MSLLFIFFIVILIIILIARLASKARPEKERLSIPKSSGLYSVKKVEDGKDHLIEALMNLLEKKGPVTEEEISAALDSVIAEKKSKKSDTKTVE